MPSWRKFRRFAYQCGLYEAQDVFAEVDNIHMICPEPNIGFEFREPFQKWLMWRDVSRQLANVNPGLKAVRLDRDYEVFIAVCQSWWDIFFINSIKNWRERCKTAICVLDEMWVAAIPDYKYWLHVFEKFDHIFLGFRDTAPVLERTIGRKVHWLPGAVDALRFTPYPNAPERTVDIYSMGRRWEGTHQAALQAARQDGLFYIYDTFLGSIAQPQDHQQHRALIANIAKRSKFFVVGPAKLGQDIETKGQLEIGYRFFEGGASGAVMIGQAPDCQSFKELFDWPNAVIHLDTDGSNFADVLSHYRARPELAAEIGRRNARESLLRHDWVYRWRRIIETAGIKPASAMIEREQRLQELAALAA